MNERKYTLLEIDDMRRSIYRFYPSGVAYVPSERSAEVEDRLRTYMQNGTDPEELEVMANALFEADIRHQEKMREMHDQYRRQNPPPPPPKTATEVIERWFNECVAKYEGASVESNVLFDGPFGQTLLKYANRHAPDGCSITIRDMERYLDQKGIRSRRLGWLGSKTYDGIRHILHGNVSHGNYST